MRFFNSQFNYCPLIWMYHSHFMRDAYISFTVSKLLEKDSSVSIHKRIIQSLSIEMICVNKNLSTPIVNDIFAQKDNSRHELELIYHGSERVLFLESKLWDMLWNYCKDIDNLNTFKKQVKKSLPENYPCRLCKVYISNKGFVSEQKKACNIKIVFLEVFLSLASIGLLVISTCIF